MSKNRVEYLMKKAGGIIGLISGIFGIIAGFVTLFMGGLGGAFNALGSETIVGLGWGGIGFSFLVIIFGAVSMSAKTRVPPTLLILSSIAGMILGGTLVAIVLLLGLLGGVLALFGGYQKGNESNSIQNSSSAEKSKRGKLFLIGGIAVLGVIAAIGLSKNGNSDSAKNAANQQILDLENSTASDLQPYGELTQIYELGGNSTDIQRDNKTAEIKGSIVDWSLQVYDVKKTKNGYKLQTSGRGLVRTSINLTVRDSEETTFVESLKTGDLIRVKAIIEDVSFRIIELNPAVLYRKDQEVIHEPVVEESEVIEEPETTAQLQESQNEFETTAVEKHESLIEEPVSQALNNEVSKPSFDCAKATTNVERLICNNAELSDWDRKVATVYAQTLKDTSVENKAAFKAQQLEWLKSRNKCISTECLVTVHQKRHSELAPWEYEEH
jgi:uncharacterized protein YecT (DUF1311 family)